MLNQLKAMQQITIEKIKKSGLYFNHQQDITSIDGSNKIANFMLQQGHCLVIYPNQSHQSKFNLEYHYQKPTYCPVLGEYSTTEISHFFLSVELDGKIIFYDQAQQAISNREANQLSQVLNLQIDNTAYFLARLATSFHSSNSNMQPKIDSDKEENSDSSLTDLRFNSLL